MVCAPLLQRRWLRTDAPAVYSQDLGARLRSALADSALHGRYRECELMDGLVCSFTGYLGQDATLRWTQNGQPLCQFSVLVADSKHKPEEPQRWIRVTLWGEEGEQLAPKLTKGSEVHILGRHRISHWQEKTTGADRHGEEVTATNVDLLGVAALRSRGAA